MFDLNGDYHLSVDRTQVLDRNKGVVAIARYADGRTVYSPTEVHAAGKICISWDFKEVKVCIEYNDAQACIGWDTVTVEFCVEWEDA